MIAGETRGGLRSDHEMGLCASLQHGGRFRQRFQDRQGGLRIADPQQEARALQRRTLCKCRRAEENEADQRCAEAGHPTLQVSATRGLSGENVTARVWFRFSKIARAGRSLAPPTSIPTRWGASRTRETPARPTDAHERPPPV